VGILSGARPGGLSGWRAYLMTGLLSGGGLAFWQAGFLAGGLSGWRTCFLAGGLSGQRCDGNGGIELRVVQMGILSGARPGSGCLRHKTGRFLPVL
jgi:hypothetical protein